LIDVNRIAHFFAPQLIRIKATLVHAARPTSDASMARPIRRSGHGFSAVKY
jgi:hypothetical protein